MSRNLKNCVLKMPQGGGSGNFGLVCIMKKDFLFLNNVLGLESSFCFLREWVGEFFCSSGCPGACFVDQTGLDLPASAS